MKWLFFFFSTALFATVNEPLRWEVFSGYRNDRIHWHLQEPGEGGTLTYSELYRDVQFWENGLVLKVIYRDLTFFMRGAYGTFGTGTVYQRNQSAPNAPHFTFDTSGWTADGTGYFGYSINLTADRTYKVILTPLIGYGGSFECLHRKSGRPDGEVSPSFQSDLPGVFRLVWNGVFLGGGFLIEPGGRLILNGGYTYHFMHNEVHTAVKTSLSDQTIKESSGGNKGHTGWLQMDGILNRFWRLGIGGQIHYFFTRVVDATIEQPNLPNSSEKLKLRWTSISAWAQISRQF